MYKPTSNINNKRPEFSRIPTRSATDVPTRPLKKAKRTSIIKTTTKLADGPDYGIRILDTPKLITALHSFGILVQEKDLLEPKPARTQVLFTLILETVAPWRFDSIQQSKKIILKKYFQKDFGQEMTEVIPLYSELTVFLGQLRFSHFKITDLTAPTKERLHLILSSIINFLLFKYDSYSQFEPYEKEASQLASETEAILIQNKEFLEEKERKEAQNESDQIDLTEWELKNQEAESKLRTLRKEGDALLTKLDLLKTGRHELKDNLQSVQYTIINDLKEHTTLKEYEKIDIQKYEKDIQEFKTYIKQYSEYITQLEESLPQLDNLYSDLKNYSTNINKCVQFLNSSNMIKKDINRHKKTNEVITNEINVLDNSIAEYSTKIGKATKLIEIHISRIEKLKVQQDKKIQSVKMHFEKCKKESLILEKELSQEQKETIKCEEELSRIKEEVKDLVSDHQLETKKLLHTYARLQTSLNLKYEQIDRF